jgi:hypothetical protein
MIDDAISGVTFDGVRFVVLTKNPFEFCGFVFHPAVIAGADGAYHEAAHVSVTDNDFGVTTSLMLIGDELIAHLLHQAFDC